MMNKSSFAPPALHVRQYSSSQTLGLVLPLNLATLPDARKRCGKWALCTVPPHTLGPVPSMLRSHPCDCCGPRYIGFTCVARNACLHHLDNAVGTSEVPIRSKSLPVRKPSPRPKLLEWPSVSHL
jgi:hypothetical protein